jgi:hypothetical protein
MKTRHYPLAAILVFQTLFAQTSTSSVDGAWRGALLFGEGKVRVILYLSPPKTGGSGGEFSGAMINLESGTASNIDRVTLAKGKVGLELKNAGLKFQGTLSPSGNEIKGRFTQGETSGDLTLTRDTASRSSIADE